MAPHTRCIYQVWNWCFKTCRKKPENFEKSKTHKSNRQNSENTIIEKKPRTCVDIYHRPPMYQIWRIYLDLWAHDFGCKLGQSDPIVMQLKLDMSCHLLNVCTKFQIDIFKHVEKNPRKRGWTDGHCHGIMHPFFKRACEKQQLDFNHHKRYNNKQ